MHKNERLAERADRQASHLNLDAKSDKSPSDGSDSYFDGRQYGHKALDHTFNTHNTLNNDSEEDSDSYTSPDRKANNMLNAGRSRNKDTTAGPGGLRTLQPTPLG